MNRLSSISFLPFRRLLCLVFCFTIAFLFVFQHKSFSQVTIKSFSADATKFVNEMQTFLEETNKEEAADVMAEFNAIWKGPARNPKDEEAMYKQANAVLAKRMKDIPGFNYTYSSASTKLSPSQMEAVYRTANSMLKKRMKAFPDFKNYLYTLISVVQSNQPDNSFFGWQSSLDKLLTGSNKYYTQYINICNNLFLTNTLFTTSSTRWVSDNNNYTFDFDSIPKILFPDLNLTDYSKGDSSVIYKTKGIYYPTKALFYGEGGKINFLRGGLSPDTVYAFLSKYSIDVSGFEWIADSCVFYHKGYFNNPLIGRLTDKLLANVTPENATYPRFESYNKRLQIKEIQRGIDFIGGFSMHGSRMQGSGSKDQDAYLVFYREKKPFLIAASKSFNVKPDKITSSRAAITFYYDKDSIYHPGVEFKYINAERELALIRSDEGMGKTPYFDSYHHLDLYFDVLYWKIDDPVMALKMLSSSGEAFANFESSDYYRDYRFNKIQGISDVHPFVKIKNFIDKIGSKEFYAQDLASDMRVDITSMRNFLISLANQGFVLYDLSTDKVTVKDRLQYYLNAKIGKTDYDVILFESSIVNKPNASLSLLNFDIDMVGVKQVFLSDSQNVYCIPKESHITVKKNRNFDFAGVVKAGRFDFYGKNFSFDYDNFKINLDNVDSLRIKVEAFKPDSSGRYPLVYVKSVLRNITGDLLIDQPFNKSGVKDYPEYPIFNSKKDSYVYYDYKSIQQGVYTKDNFYFHLTPFSIDSLDNFTREGLAFGGSLVSADIFPEFKDTLKLQPDYSLGLIRQTPPGGFPAYKGKGTYFKTINLSNRGLLGDGVLKYLSSTTTSNNFVFFPDSTNATAQSYIVDKGVLSGTEYPAVKVSDVGIHWKPYEDVMFVFGQKQIFDFYEGQATFKGDLELAPKGLAGHGIMNFAESDLEAKLFKYQENKFRSDTADFRINAKAESQLAFEAKNMQADIDFTKRSGEFKSNGGISPVKFPINQYICFIDKFTWLMDQKSIKMASSQAVAGSENAVSLQGSQFISVHPDQDSLRFVAPEAEYNYGEFIIRAKGVQYIVVADASIFPDSGNVLVRRKANMDPFSNAKIIANNVTKYHNMYNGELKIASRKSYSGTADYDFIDQTKTKEVIHFTSIGVDTALQTTAVGAISDTTFSLGAQFLYKGDVELQASRQFLNFKGFSKLKYMCDPMKPDWFSFNGGINPTSISIPISSKLRDDKGGVVSAGILLAADTTIIYPAFLSSKLRSADIDIISADGNLIYDKDAKEYRIAPADKLLNNALPGNLVSLKTKDCEIYGEGKINIGGNLGQVKMNTVGNATYKPANHNANMDLLLILDFFFNEDAMKIMADHILSTAILTPTNDNRPTYEKGMAELVGKEKAGQLISEMNLYGAYKKFPQELNQSIFFTDLKMAYKPEYKSFRSSGLIGVGNILKTQVNRQVGGTIEVMRKRSGDVLNIYLELDGANWYFFSYTRGVMQAISSNEAFNKIIREMKPEKKIAKTDDNKNLYQFMLSTERKKNDFIKKTFDKEDEEK